MALVFADRVLETCSAPGTGSVSLLGATTGYRTFSATVGNANTCYYTIADQSGANWEVGLGTYATSGNTLARTTVLASSNSGSLVNFSSGTQNVFLDYPASKAVSIDFTNTFTAKNTFSGSTSVLAAVFNNAAETTLLTSTAAPAAITFDVNAQSVSYYYSTVAANNWTVNFRHSSGTTLNTAMAIGQTVTVTIMVAQGTTAYYNSGVSIDGTALTAGTNLYWQGGISPSAGNSSAVDMYTYAIVKTAASTFKVFAAQTKFA